MRANLIRKQRDGSYLLKPILIKRGPDNNGLISFEVLDQHGNPKPYIGGTCRINDIQFGKVLWKQWPYNYQRVKQ